MRIGVGSIVAGAWAVVHVRQNTAGPETVLGLDIDATTMPLPSVVFAYISLLCTSKARHSSVTSRGRDRDRPLRCSIRCSRLRTSDDWAEAMCVSNTRARIGERP